MSIKLDKYFEEITEPVRKSLKSGISYIVMTYDTPYILTVNNHKYSLDAFLCFPYDSILSNLTPLRAIKKNGVDTTEQSYSGTINSYYNTNSHFHSNGRNFLVTRIDGPTPAIAKELVDRALYGEEYINTKYGKCYFDARGLTRADGAYYDADLEIIEAYGITKSKGYNCILDKNSAEFDNGICPDALFYYGWYSYNNYNDAFAWKVGAVGIHLDSASASGIRGGPSWASGALKRGISATIGAISEPFVTTYTKANLFFKYFLDGYNFAESSYLSTPVSKWMMCMIGDPLYNPSKSSQKNDTTKPKIIAVEFVRDEDNPHKEGIINIETDKFCAVKVEYGTDINYENLKEVTAMFLKHKIKLKDLNPATAYSAKITCMDSSNNQKIKEVKFST